MICRNRISGQHVCLLRDHHGRHDSRLTWVGYPPSLASLPLLLATVWFFFTFKRPMRMDYSLFLRAAHGQLKISGEPDVALSANHFDRRALKSFARFLGARLLVSNFRWETNGLALRLPPVANRFLANMAAFCLCRRSAGIVRTFRWASTEQSWRAAARRICKICWR